MCGIVGVVHLDEAPVELPVLAHMAAALDHRGPDGEGHYVRDRVGLYHKRLAIIDIAGGAQPMTIDDRTVVFNGEIYNYVELREQLRRLGHEFRTSSDTEVLLRLYLEFGDECVRRLNGMFAFLLYDAPHGRLLVARDHFGIKPLYTYRDGHRLLFASEVKALLRHPAVRAERDPVGFADYLTFQHVLGEGTLFRGVRRVPPAHYVSYDVATGAARTTRYWEPNFDVDPYHSEEYFVTETRRLLSDSVHLQLRSDVPVGAYLSGGLDSSVVTMLAALGGAGRLKTFTGAFREGPEFDETPYASAVARAAGTEAFTVVPTEQDFVDLLPQLVYHMDEPVAGPGLFPQFVVSRHAAQHVKVVLGGQGGDEIFGGYARYLVAYLEQALKGAIFETNEEDEHIVSLKSIIPNLPALRAYGPMMGDFWRDGLFEPMDRRYFRLIDRSGGGLALLSDDARAEHCPDAVFARFQQVFNHSDTLSYFNRMSRFDLMASLPALLHVEDRASMAASLESRVPLLDRRLVDLVTSMPPRMKFKGGELKYLLKRAVRDLIPPKVMHRKDKMGFPVPLHLWARGRAREYFEDILLSQRARERGIFAPRAIERLLREEAAFGRRLWGVLNIELWHRQFVDGQGDGTPSIEHAVARRPVPAPPYHLRESPHWRSSADAAHG